jgi:hypothetical protein
MGTGHLDLSIVYGFRPHAKNFHSYGDVTIAAEGLQS